MSAFIKPRQNSVDFDEDGPRLGPIRLLAKSRLGFMPRPADELNLIFAQTLDQPQNLDALQLSLESIARHMNSGDMAMAAIATGYLSLPNLSKAQCERARDVEALLKASPDNPKHPGWPAGAPDGQGGRFRLKDAAVGFAAADKAESVKRLAQKRTFRTVLVRALLSKRGLRLLGENPAAALTEEIPGVDAVVTAAALADDVSFLEDIAADVKDSKAAMDFLKRGPVDLEDLMVPAGQPQGFTSFDAFKKVELESSSDRRETASTTTISSNRDQMRGYFQRPNCNRRITSSRYLVCFMNK